MSCSLIPILSEANSRRETDVSVIYCVFKKSKIKCMADIKLSSWDSLRESTIISTALMTGFPGGANSKEPVSQCRRYKRPGFDPWVGKIPWRRAWQPTPVFLPGESHRQRYLVGLHGVTKTWTGLKQLGMHTHSHDIYKMVRTIIVSRVISIGYFKSRSTNVQHLPQVFIFVNLWRYLLCLPC